LLRAHRAGPAVLSGLIEPAIARARARWLAGGLPDRAPELVTARTAVTARNEEAQLRAHHAVCQGADGCPHCAFWRWIQREDRLSIRGTLIALTGTRTLLQDESELGLWQAAQAARSPAAAHSLQSSS
jgi:hypothetical protein